MNIWLESVKKKKLLTPPGKKKKGEDVLFDHDVEEVGASKNEEQKQEPVQAQQRKFLCFISVVEKWKDFLASKTKYIKNNFNLENPANGVGNKILILLLMVIAYLLWQIYTLQVALSK